MSSSTPVFSSGKEKRPCRRTTEFEFPHLAAEEWHQGKGGGVPVLPDLLLLQRAIVKSLVQLYELLILYITMDVEGLDSFHPSNCPWVHIHPSAKMSRRAASFP